MGKYFTAEFKMEAVKRIERTGEPVSKVAEELGINVNTLHGWIHRYRDEPDCPFPGSGKLSPEADRLRKMERENRDLREEVAILKKAAVYFVSSLKSAVNQFSVKQLNYVQFRYVLL